MEALTLIPNYGIKPYRGDTEKLLSIAVAFTGAPHKHPSDPNKILLLNDPFSQQGFFFEFKAGDIVYAEEVTSLSKPDGSTQPMVRLWITKGVTALKIVPFQVQDMSKSLAGFF
ncbi:MAG: inorganic pyrophosphatase Ppa [Deltaproteobacteria bacterium]|nr:inorganic pyrophosphatase Ppa [Deltaproteobacteria bacterium]